MMRITAARELLEGDSASIHEVSERVGYADLNFFRSLFKRHTGMTPAEYRARFSSVHYRRAEPEMSNTE
jgi:AraC-like DNA-binding protein